MEFLNFDLKIHTHTRTNTQTEKDLSFFYTAFKRITYANHVLMEFLQYVELCGIDSQNPQFIRSLQYGCVHPYIKSRLILHSSHDNLAHTLTAVDYQP